MLKPSTERFTKECFGNRQIRDKIGTNFRDEDEIASVRIGARRREGRVCIPSPRADQLPRSAQGRDDAMRNDSRNVNVASDDDTPSERRRYRLTAHVAVAAANLGSSLSSSRHPSSSLSRRVRVAAFFCRKSQFFRPPVIARAASSASTACSAKQAGGAGVARGRRGEPPVPRARRVQLL